MHTVGYMKGPGARGRQKEGVGKAGRILKLEVGSWKLKVGGREGEAFMGEGIEEYNCPAE